MLSRNSMSIRLWMHCSTKIKASRLAALFKRIAIRDPTSAETFDECNGLAGLMLQNE